MKRIFFIVCLLPLGAIAQTLDQIWASDTTQIPKDSKLVIVQKVGFIQVCNALLDAGYKIEKKDNELQTVTTNVGQQNDVLDIRIRDSVATIKPQLKVPGYKDWFLEVKWELNKKGKSKRNTYTYTILKAVQVARITGGQITYQ